MKFSRAVLASSTQEQDKSFRGEYENGGEMYKDEIVRAKRAELLFFFVKCATL